MGGSSSDSDSGSESGSESESDNDNSFAWLASFGRGHPKRAARVAALMKRDTVSSARDRHMDPGSGRVQAMRRTELKEYALSPHLVTALQSATSRIIVHLNIPITALSRSMLPPVGASMAEIAKGVARRVAFQDYVSAGMRMRLFSFNPAMGFAQDRPRFKAQDDDAFYDVVSVFTGL
jgi:hypothetical protein